MNAPYVIGAVAHTAVISAVAIASVGLFFFTPHHKPNRDAGKRYTLWEIHEDFLTQVPRVKDPRTLLFMCVGFMGLFAAFYPAILLLVSRWLGPVLTQDARFGMILVGAACIVGTLVNVAFMIVSILNFGWGVGSKSGTETIFFWLIPLFQGAFAIASIVMGLSISFANWFYRFASI